MSDQARTDWKCECGHVLGFVQRNKHEVRRLVITEPIPPAASQTSPNPPGLRPSPFSKGDKDKEGGETVVEIEGYARLYCPVCGRSRVWMPGKEALRELMERCGVLEQFDGLEVER